MKTMILKLGLWLSSVQTALVGLGFVGICAIAFLDAAFIPLPGGPDIVLISLSYQTPALMPLYVLAAVVGSTAGSLILVSIAQATGDATIKHPNSNRRARIHRMLDRYDIWALVVAAVLPPPFPFKLFVVPAGLFHMKKWRVTLALILGRGFRFVLEGVAAVYYGNRAATLLKQNYSKIALWMVAAVVLAFLVSTFWRSRTAQDSTSPAIALTEAAIESEAVRPGDSMPIV
jgi:membrane protein YqaA with SNARE-associated domain